MTEIKESDKRRQDALDYFGEQLMIQVRDRVINVCDREVEEELKVPGSRGYSEVASLNEQQLKLLRQLIPDIVDNTLHYLLYALNETPAIEVTVHTPSGDVRNIRSLSDESIGGLHYELYGPEGWLRKFSRQRPSSSP